MSDAKINNNLNNVKNVLRDLSWDFQDHANNGAPLPSSRHLVVLLTGMIVMLEEVSETIPSYVDERVRQAEQDLLREHRQEQEKMLDRLSADNLALGKDCAKLRAVSQLDKEELVRLRQVILHLKPLHPDAQKSPEEYRCLSDMPDRAVAHIKAGYMIEAIKVVREVFGMGLGSAKMAVDGYHAALLRGEV